MTKRCHRVIQLTDLHLVADPAGEVHGHETDATARRVIEAVAAEPADLVVLSGDLADRGEPEAYERMLDHLEGIACPVVPMPGNHDCAATLNDIAARRGRPVLTHLDLGRWRLHFLDSAVPGRASGELGAARLAALASNLADRPTLVFVHHQPVPVDSAWIDAMGLEDGAELMGRLADRPVPTVVACGHVHQAVSGWRGSVRWMTTPSTCSQFRPHSERVIDDEVGPGYRWFELRDDGFCATGVVRV